MEMDSALLLFLNVNHFPSNVQITRSDVLTSHVPIPGNHVPQLEDVL